MCGAERANSRSELLQELIGMHEHGKVSAALDRHKLLARSFDGFEIFSSERSRSREIFLSFKDEYRDRELQSEVRGSHRRRLRDKAFGAQHLAIDGIIDVLHGTPWSDEREANRPK